jgi:hypothetical protein
MLILNLSIISRNGREVVGTATLPCRPRRELAAGLVVTAVEAEVAVAEVVIVPVMGRLALIIGRVVNVTAPLFCSSIDKNVTSLFSSTHEQSGEKEGYIREQK